MSAVAHGTSMADHGYRWHTAVLATLTLAVSILPPGLAFVRGEPVGAPDGGVFGALPWPLLFLLGTWVVVRRLRLALALLPWINWLLPLLLGWFLASTLWSAAPGETARRSVRLAALALCAFAWILASWRPGRFWRLARYTLGLIAAGSVAVALLMPDIGLHGAGSPEAGKWRGLTTNKNLLGACAAIGALLWLHAWGAREVPLRQAMFWLAACLAALAGARSTSSLYPLLLCGPLLLLWLRPPLAIRGWAGPIAATVVLVTLPVHVALMWQGSLSPQDVLAPLADAAGKDVTLTGRAELWRYLMDEIPRHPWLGLGHGAYWLGEFGASGPVVRELYWIPNQGHNFYLDLANETGAVGVLLFVALLASWVVTLRRVDRIDRPLAALNGTVLLFLLIHGITETVMLRALTPMTVLMCFGLLDMNRRLFEESLRRKIVSARGAQAAHAIALEQDKGRGEQQHGGAEHHGRMRPAAE